MSEAALGPRPITEDLGLAAAVAAGGFLLLARPTLSSSAGSPVLGLCASYVALLAVSTAPPIPAAASRSLRPAIALAVGLAALAVSIQVAGPAFPLRARPAGLALSVLAAIAEEAFFRRLLYGALLRRGVPVAILLSAVAFALVHVPVYGMAALWIDLGAGLLFGWQRWASGGLAAPAATHVAANLLTLLG
jgi:membrane protease YdiL (CAAX protease family)